MKHGAGLVQEVIRVPKGISSDVIPLAHGGPFVTHEDTHCLHKHADAVGFVGVSSGERIPIESAAKEVVEKIKASPLRRRQ